MHRDSHSRFISVLRPLGIVGYDAIEPAIVAALATEEPLLLISDHGAAKTLLLLRIAEALGLSIRHYNASLLQFDDLAGFPIPDDKGGIRYAAAPGAIWGAEAVFIDEIGRCRPETANKLFPIIHEKKIQGIPLDSLRYRWAATNPPPEASGAEAHDNLYEGVEVLDPALADRFSYIVRLPLFSELSDADRSDVIRGIGGSFRPGAGEQLREAVETTRRLIPSITADITDGVVGYVLSLLPGLSKAQITIGGRRAATLARNFTAIWAARLMLGRPTGEGAFADALCRSIPDIVRRNIAQSTLLAAHKSAWKATTLSKSDPRRVLCGITDPVERALLAVTLPQVAADVRGEALCGALAAAKQHEAEIVAWLVLPRLLRGDLTSATTIETVGDIVSAVAEGGYALHGFGTTNEWIRNARSEIARSWLPQESADYLFNVIVRSNAPSGQLSAGTGDRSWKDPVRHCLALWCRCERALGVLADSNNRKAA